MATKRDNRHRGPEPQRIVYGEQWLLLLRVHQQFRSPQHQQYYYYYYYYQQHRPRNHDRSSNHHHHSVGTDNVVGSKHGNNDDPPPSGGEVCQAGSPGNLRRCYGKRNKVRRSASPTATTCTTRQPELRTAVKTPGEAKHKTTDFVFGFVIEWLVGWWPGFV